MADQELVPFREDGTIDYEGLEENVRFLLDNGAEGFTSGLVNIAAERSLAMLAALRRGTGVRLHYVLAGEETADPLVLLHGFPQSLLMWRLVLPAMAASHFVVAVDLRGYGDSEKPPRSAGHGAGRTAVGRPGQPGRPART